ADLVRAMLSDPPAPSIALGPAGIGKSTLTIAALRDPQIEKRFASRRWFVRLDAAPTADAAIGKIGEVLGISLRGDPLAEPRGFLARAPGVLVLDNLETPWDGEREATEALLAALTDIPGLVLVASMRGAQTPEGVTWSEMVRLAPLALPVAAELFC